MFTQEQLTVSVDLPDPGGGQHLSQTHRALQLPGGDDDDGYDDDVDDDIDDDDDDDDGSLSVRQTGNSSSR